MFSFSLGLFLPQAFVFSFFLSLSFCHRHLCSVSSMHSWLLFWFLKCQYTPFIVKQAVHGVIFCLTVFRSNEKMKVHVELHSFSLICSIGLPLARSHLLRHLVQTL